MPHKSGQQISLHGSTSIEYLMHACRSYSEVSDVIRATARLADNSILLSSGINIGSSFYLDKLLSGAEREVPLPTSLVGYNRKSKQANVSTVSVRGIILYGIVVGLAILVLPLKELLAFFAIRRKGVPESELFLNFFDDLSKTYRSEIERFKKMPDNGEFANTEK